MIRRLLQRLAAWLRGGRVVLEVSVGDRPLLRRCECGRTYITPPLGVDDPGTCWIHRRAA